MQKRILVLAAGALLFITAVIVMLAVNLHFETKPEEYRPQASHVLPIVSFSCEGMYTDPLIGYADHSDSVASSSEILPNTDDTVEICYSDISNIASAKAILESEDRQRLIDVKELEFFRKRGTYRSNYDISVMASVGERYMLTIQVDTKDGKTGYYTT